ncbi:MAG TPA: efflux RND transporter periplasmic adaptor subunit [Gemmataceae bacterium]|nr:efflux RND transporter periplasmic adaptor subunit [Gemmataceae bacterium]
MDEFKVAKQTTSGCRRSFWRTYRSTTVGLLCVAAAIGVAGCDQASHTTEQEKKAIEVIVTTPITDEVTDYQDFTGRLDALKTVDIRARVSGFVMTAPFKEGDVVHEGDLLFHIDPRTYRATYNQTEANLKQAIADRNLQEKNSLRARRMIEGRSIAQEDYDTTLATLEKSRATVGSMEAARDMAKLYLDFTQVTAPLTGRISRRLVDPGNLVTADSTLLTTIVADSTLYAYFDVDERTYLDLTGPAGSAANPLHTELKFPVLMRLANENDFAHTCTINFVDNRVSANSGTIRMRAIFDNANGLLKPGLFVHIRLPIGNPYQAVLVPNEALMWDQGRKYVFVVNNKDEVEYRAVEPGQQIQGLCVIKKNLKLGERVIISGMQRVKQKAKVEVKMSEPPKRPDSPLGRLLSFNRPTPPATASKHGEKAGQSDQQQQKQTGVATAPGG